ncbi:MAG: hypothetical protein LBQ73_02290 [Tannerellaceae bacterium]|jgi:hypothetical protein|nr:hypothetical protein [Tannerellaceae bacterium]
MRKLFILILLPTLLACSKGDDPEPEQDYTSFTFVHHVDATFPNCVVGYYRDGLCFKLAELGDLQRDKESKEFVVEDDDISDIYLFSDYYPYFIDGYWVIKFDATYRIRNNKKNNFTISADTKGIYVNKNDPVQYPH